jgi:hypothetical protein
MVIKRDASVLSITIGFIYAIIGTDGVFWGKGIDLFETTVLIGP